QLLRAVLLLQAKLHAVDGLVDAGILVETGPGAVADPWRAEVADTGTGASRRLEGTRRGAAIAVAGVAVIPRSPRFPHEVPARRRPGTVHLLERAAVADEGVGVHGSVPVDEAEESALRVRDRHVDAGRHVDRVVPPEPVLLADVKEGHLVGDALDGLDVGLREPHELLRGAEAAHRAQGRVRAHADDD